MKINLKYPIKLIFAAIFFIFTINSKLAVAEIKPSIDEFITAQTTIRVAMDNTPGFGNQSASATLMSRMRGLGFNGTFEVIYANLTATKIKTLFNLPDNFSADYYDEKTKIRFIELKKFVALKKNNQEPIVSLALLGRGDDFGCSLAKDDGVDIDKDLSPLDCINSANLLNVKTLLTVSPFYSEPNRLSQLNDNNPSYPKYQPDKEQPNSEGKYFPLPLTSLTEVENYFAHHIDGQKMLQKVPAFSAYLTGLVEKSFNILPVYGYTIQSTYQSYVTRQNPDFVGNIFQVLTGARYAQLTGPNDLHKPLIIPIFYDYHAEAEKISQLMIKQNWAEDELPGATAIRQAIQDLGLNNSFYTMDIANPLASNQIKNLKPGDVLLLWMGPLPKNVFEGLYGYTDSNVWPQIYEGANSGNVLVETGKASFHCGRPEENNIFLHGPFISDELAKFYDKSDDYSAQLHGFCRGMKTWEAQPDFYKNIGQLIIDAGNPKSDFAKHYQWLQKDVLNPTNDRVLYGLQGVIDQQYP